MAARKNYSEKRMPFLEHLEELRWHIFRSFISVFVLTLGFYIFSAELVDFFTRPYPHQLQALGATDPFMIRVKISFFMALLASIPVIVREVWAFIAPGLLEHERKHIPLIIFLTSLCFLVGASFAFFIVLPLTVKFLLSFQTEKMVANVTIDKWLGFVTQMLLGFGVVFELPMLAMFLTRIGLITPHLMRKYRSYAIVAIFVIAAVITPSTDATTQLALAGPLMVLYELSILISGMIVKRKKEQEEQEEKEYEEELRREAERRRKAAKKAASEKEDDGEHLKMWETEGDHYEPNKKSDSGTSQPEGNDQYPYDMNPMYDEYYGDPYSSGEKKEPEGDKGTGEKKKDLTGEDKSDENKTDKSEDSEPAAPEKDADDSPKDDTDESDKKQPPENDNEGGEDVPG